MATEADLPAVYDRMILQSASFFRDTLPKDFREPLYHYLKYGQALGDKARSFMEKRSILDKAGALKIPLTLRWLEQEVG